MRPNSSLGCVLAKWCKGHDRNDFGTLYSQTESIPLPIVFTGSQVGKGNRHATTCDPVRSSADNFSSNLGIWNSVLNFKLDICDLCRSWIQGLLTLKRWDKGPSIKTLAHLLLEVSNNLLCLNTHEGNGYCSIYQPSLNSAQFPHELHVFLQHCSFSHLHSLVRPHRPNYNMVGCYWE